MGNKSSDNNNPDELNQEKNMEEHPHQSISSEIKDNQKNNQDENCPPAPEVEADFVLGDLIEQLLHKDKNIPANDSNNITGSDTAQIGPLKFENNSAIFEISDTNVDSFLEKNKTTLEELSSDSDIDSVSENDSTDSNPENNLIDVNIDTTQEKEQVVENKSEDNPIEPVPIENSLKDVEIKNDLQVLNKSDENFSVGEERVFSDNAKPPEFDIQHIEGKNVAHISEDSDSEVSVGKEIVVSDSESSSETSFPDDEETSKFQKTEASEEDVSMWEVLMLPIEANQVENNVQDKIAENESQEIDDSEDDVKVGENISLPVEESSIKNNIHYGEASNESQMDNVSHVSEFKMVNDKLSYFYNGINFYLKKNFVDAIIEFKKGLKIDPDSKLASILLGNSFFRNNMLIEARSIYEKLKKKFPVDSLVLENLGVIYNKQGMYQLAEKEWKTLVRLDPQKKEIKNKLEKSLHNLSQKIEKPVVKNGDKIAMLIFDGINFYKNKNYDSAINAFKSAINRYPDDKNACNFLANTYFRNKMLKEAILTYENFIYKYKGNISANENIGLIYAKQGEYNKAIDEWEKVIESNPERRDIKKKIERVLQLI